MPTPDSSLVKDFPFFRHLGDEELRAVLRLARTRRLAKKTVVFAERQIATEFFVLLHGHLKVVKTSPDDREVIVRIVQPGELYGMAVALGRRDYPATAIAMEESITLVWPSSAWAGMVQRSPALAANALQTLGQRVQEAHALVRELSTEEVERRVAHALLRMSKAGAKGPDESTEIGYPITRKDIAEMSGTTLFSVSRVLSNWEKQGVVASGRERIAIRDPERLKVIAAGGSAADQLAEEDD